MKILTITKLHNKTEVPFRYISGLVFLVLASYVYFQIKPLLEQNIENAWILHTLEVVIALSIIYGFWTYIYTAIRKYNHSQKEINKAVD